MEFKFASATFSTGKLPVALRPKIVARVMTETIVHLYKVNLAKDGGNGLNWKKAADSAVQEIVELSDSRFSASLLLYCTEQLADSPLAEDDRRTVISYIIDRVHAECVEALRPSAAKADEPGSGTWPRQSYAKPDSQPRPIGPDEDD